MYPEVVRFGPELIGKLFVAMLTFLLGFDFILVLMSAFLRGREGAWLPIVFSLIIVELLRLIPKLMTAVVRSLIGLALVGGMIGFWFISQPPPGPDNERMFILLPPISFGLPIGAYLLWLCFTQDRRTVSSLTWSLIGLLISLMWGVAYFSSSHGGAGGMLHFMVTSLGVPERFAENVLVPLRKTIHFSFYGTVALLAWNVAQSSLDMPKKSGRRLAFGLLIALSLASFDELRQATQPGRTGAVTDVVLDMCGALAFVGVAEFQKRRSEERTAHD